MIHPSDVDPARYFPEGHLPNPFDTHFEVFNTSVRGKAEDFLEQGEPFYANMLTIRHVLMEAGLAFASENHGEARAAGGTAHIISHEAIPSFTHRDASSDYGLFAVVRAVEVVLLERGVYKEEHDIASIVDIRDARAALAAVLELDEFSDAAAVAKTHYDKTFGRN